MISLVKFRRQWPNYCTVQYNHSFHAPVINCISQWYCTVSYTKWNYTHLWDMRVSALCAIGTPFESAPIAARACASSGPLLLLLLGARARRRCAPQLWPSRRSPQDVHTLRELLVDAALSRWRWRPSGTPARHRWQRSTRCTRCESYTPALADSIQRAA